MDNPDRPPPAWKVTIAATLDFLLAFVAGGYIVAKLTGNTHEYGFRLEGWPALAGFALIVGYFVVGNRFFGGTVFKHLLGIAKKP